LNVIDPLCVVVVFDQLVVDILLSGERTRKTTLTLILLKELCLSVKPWTEREKLNTMSLL